MSNTLKDELGTLASFHKEIDLVQDIIKRMAANSFSIKGWTYAITGATLALSKDIFFAPQKHFEAILLCLFIIIIITLLWYLDAFFLLTEKKYRHLYAWLIETRIPQAPEGKPGLEHRYVLLPKAIPAVVTKIAADEEIDSKTPQLQVMGNKTLWPFYLPLLALVVALLFYNIATVALHLINGGKCCCL